MSVPKPVIVSHDLLNTEWSEQEKPSIHECYLFIKTKHREILWDKDNKLTHKEIATALREMADYYDVPLIGGE